MTEVEKGTFTLTWDDDGHEQATISNMSYANVIACLEYTKFGLLMKAKKKEMKQL